MIERRISGKLRQHGLMTAVGTLSTVIPAGSRVEVDLGSRMCFHPDLSTAVVGVPTSLDLETANHVSADYSTPRKAVYYSGGILASLFGKWEYIVS